jgi:hypothetical protein
MSAIQAERVRATPRRASRPVIEPAPEYGPFATRVTYFADGVWLRQDRVVIYLHRELECASESLIMELIYGGETAWRSPASLNAEFAARRDAATDTQGRKPA